jgi:hypothetical protein
VVDVSVENSWELAAFVKAPPKLNFPEFRGLHLFFARKIAEESENSLPT